MDHRDASQAAHSQLGVCLRAARQQEGDGVYLDSTLGHAYLNAGDEPARGVCLCTSESANLYEQLRHIAMGK